MEAKSYANIVRPTADKDNMGGLVANGAYAAIGDFLVIQKEMVATTIADIGVIEDDHTFKTGKCFKKCYCTEDKGKGTDKVQGERDGRSYKSQYEIFVPGADVGTFGFTNQSKNDQFIFMAIMPDGVQRQIGTEDFPAEIVGEFETGTNASGIRGVKFMIEAMSPRLYTYTGVISYTAAS